MNNSKNDYMEDDCVQKMIFGGTDMPFYEREENILSLLNTTSEVTTKELSKSLFVSEPTVRRDLKKLEADNAIIRTSKGAILKSHSKDMTIPFALRQQEYSDTKMTIGKKAAAFVQDGSVIFLDATTTAFSVIPFLKDKKDITVVTNGIKNTVLLSEMNIKNICMGGKLINSSLASVGEEAEEVARRYNADIFFFSCRGVSFDGNLTDNSIEENRLKRVMMKRAEKNIFLCGSSKFGRCYINNLCPLSEIDEIISEKAVPKEFESFIK